MMVFLSTTSAVEFMFELFARFEVSRSESQSAEADTEADTQQEEVRPGDGIMSKLLGITIFKLHGDMDQSSRTRTHAQFAKSKEAVMFCTDVGMCANGVRGPRAIAIELTIGVNGHASSCSRFGFAWNRMGCSIRPTDRSERIHSSCM
jgi:superfamily II DNA/RNA helicase